MGSSVGVLLASVGVLSLAALPALAQDPRPFTNKLAPYVASPARVVDLMLELAKIKPGETVYDLGSGDHDPAIPASQVDDRLARLDLSHLEHQIHHARRRRHIRRQLIGEGPRILAEGG
jgi:hypothetical protein